MSTSQLYRRNADARGYTMTSDACSYKQVYEQCGSQGNSNGVNPVPTSGQYVVPDYGAIGYDALTHGNAGGGCNNYFNIEQAYGAGAGSCSTSYSVRACGGCGGGQPVAPAAARKLMSNRQRRY
jgi:hypothetical protein